jgi:hypothetical protein
MENQSEEVLEEVDVEACAKEGRPVPRARRYRIRIDKQLYTVTVDHLTGAQILELAGKTPATFILSEKLHGGQAKVIEPEKVVSFLAPGVERFMTTPRDTTEG